MRLSVLSESFRSLKRREPEREPARAHLACDPLDPYRAAELLGQALADVDHLLEGVGSSTYAG